MELPITKVVFKILFSAKKEVAVKLRILQIWTSCCSILFERFRKLKWKLYKSNVNKMSIEYETTTSRARYINKSTSIVACWCSGRFQKQGTAVRNSYQYLQFLWLFFYQLLIVHKSKDFKEIVWSKNDLTKRNRQVIISRIFDWFCQSVVKNRNLNLCKKILF